MEGVTVQMRVKRPQFARKLLIALWRYAKDGVIPEGTKMKMV
jgi:hypothetical protein